MSDRVIQAMPAVAYHIGTVARKLAAGTYQTEPVACFCGSIDAQLVTETDRYGLPHRLWLCKSCGIIYANPRMTEASYAAFYESDYRNIYDDGDASAETQFEEGYRHAVALMDYLDETQPVHPSVVFDIGCNSGGWLKPFMDAGCEVHGVDYGPERVAQGKAMGIPLSVGSIETLEIMGTKADLIIMNHVLEHATNLESTLARVRALLSPDGLLYVALPGLFLADLSRLFQNAHPWQFTAETLIYVMECCGFDEVRCDQTITSIWKRSDQYRDKQDTPTRHVRDIAQALFIKGTRYLPHIRTVNKFSLPVRKAALASAMARNLPTATDLIQVHQGHPAIVIGGGPSVEGYVESIKTLQQSGAKILSIERMYPWCLLHGIIPDYVVTMDASEDVTDAFQSLHPGSHFLVASQCTPSVFDALLGHPVTLVHTSQHGYTNEELLGSRDSYTVVNGAGSVVLCALSLAMLMGMETIHLFGFDCHVTQGTYAKGIAGVGEQAETVGVKVDGRAFTTTVAYAAFAQQFFELKEIGQTEGLLKDVIVYGDSLVTAMSVQPIGAQKA